MNHIQRKKNITISRKPLIESSSKDSIKFEFLNDGDNSCTGLLCDSVELNATVVYVITHLLCTLII